MAKDVGLDGHSAMEMSATNHAMQVMTDHAIEIQDLHFSYGFSRWKIEVLKGVSLNVPAGTIYGLLGPSGCGKTTLLKCVVGTLKPDDGLVRAFGRKPGSPGSKIPGSGVGYMPQEIALYRELTIRETLAYFGRLHGMKSDNVKSRTEFLLDFLNLPHERKMIKNLSGGQQRRVSFSVALLHEPPLLILDEPTVGVDPVLRLSIWEHLLEICISGSVTVIITTHYIEEARQANKVGLMRKGKILAEDAPDTLIKHYELASLEDVFFKLCQNDKTDSYVKKDGNIYNFQTTTAKSTPKNCCKKCCEKCNCIEYCALPSLGRINALTIKNLIRMWRTLILLIFQYLSPAIQIILFCLSIGAEPRDLNVAVLNEDMILGSRYLRYLDNKTIHQLPVSTAEQAEELVINGDAWGIISIGSNFTPALLERFLCASNLSYTSAQAGSIQIRQDNTDHQIAQFIQKAFFEAFETFSIEAQKEIGKTYEISVLPFQFGDPIYGSTKPRFIEYLASGLILSLIFFLAVGLTALSFVIDKKEGLLDRSFVSGVTSFEIMCGHIITQFGVMALQVCIVLVLIIEVFGVENKGSIVLIIALALLQGMCGMTYGFLISTICNEEASAMMLALGSFYPLLLLSGTLWPIQAMPTALQKFSQGLPQTLAMNSMRWVMNRGRDLTWTPVWIGFLVSCLWIFVFIILSITVLRFKL